MIINVTLMPKAIKDLQKIQKTDALKIVRRLQEMEKGLNGNIKKLTNFTPEYRLRIGDYRILFELSGNEVIVYRITHRKQAYANK